jgi:CDP-4-dehydro-6-deoxyglucose reductase
MSRTRYLNVAMAARLAGVSRAEIQREIRAGRLKTFEGMVSVDDLRAVYPDIELEDNSVIERVQAIKDAALFKYADSEQSDEQALREEVNRLRAQLSEARVELGRYRNLVLALKERLEQMQQSEDCTRQQKLVLQALVGWMLTRMRRQG